MTDKLFLRGVPVAHVCARLATAGGDEIGSGKFAHPESSAALAVNAFGWFIERPMDFPPLPGTEAMGMPERVEVEYCARLPWSGGRHPWLDAVVITPTHLIGVESKRFEPFRDTKTISMSPAYDRPVWGERMDRYAVARDALRSGELRFLHLDAAQLVKHAFGLVTEARRLSRNPVLFYLYAEPSERGEQQISAEDHSRHRDEIAAFVRLVDGDEVTFLFASYRRWIDTASPVADAKVHLAHLRQRFGL
jgi:restriction endonuclease-like protein